MASVFTYDPDPPKVSSPWSTPGTSTPLPTARSAGAYVAEGRACINCLSEDPTHPHERGLTKLEAEPQEGPTEYKLHLLLRPRRSLSATSTVHLVSGSQHSRSRLASSHPVSDTAHLAHAPQAPSNHMRQNRLQQLTTQLLWRLQQSSPFHSSSTADLVLPVLPDATPRLGVPSRPARLLPGLEESQGALYEIGVSDDGMFVGLTEDELDESLTNLQAMAASLGCSVEVLRRVVVGDCQWIEYEADARNESKEVIRTGKLWVAEALVRPDLSELEKGRHDQAPDTISPLRAPVDAWSTNELEISRCARLDTEQLRVSLTGTTTSGKSSLLGTLSTSTFDNGRGKSRLSLLKHRHEIASGITSSVAQELIGYRLVRDDTIGPPVPADVINYAAGNVSSWNDIQANSEGARLIFLSDSPGLPRFSKSAVRTLISWDPHWTLLCVAADEHVGSDNTILTGATASAREILAPAAAGVDLSLTHLDLCLKLNLPLVLVVTKLDLASRIGLKHTLAKLLSALKSGGRRPLLLSSVTDHIDEIDLQHITPRDVTDIPKHIATISEDIAHVVPIVLTSSVTGYGIGRLHALLRVLPIPILPVSVSTPGSDKPSHLFHVDEVLIMPPSKVYGNKREASARHGVVLCGYVSLGSVSIGDELTLGPFAVESHARNQAMHRSLSFPNDRLSPNELGPTAFSKSASQARLIPEANIPPRHRWQKVRIVSIRNLRVPVRILEQDQVGTIGIVPVSSATSNLARSRKGMVLASFPFSPSAYTGFTATFPGSDFSSPSSPALILGGHTIIYCNSIRAAAKVTCVALADEGTSSLPSEDLFAFDVEEGEAEDSKVRQEDIRITFSFISTTEWFMVGTKVLVMPSTTGGTPATGLEGFVGNICEAIPDMK